jgi:hypothetical protein
MRFSAERVMTTEFFWGVLSIGWLKEVQKKLLLVFAVP